jgi:hypothetical protein
MELGSEGGAAAFPRGCRVSRGRWRNPQRARGHHDDRLGSAPNQHHERPRIGRPLENSTTSGRGRGLMRQLPTDAAATRESMARRRTPGPRPCRSPDALTSETFAHPAIALVPWHEPAILDGAEQVGRTVDVGGLAGHVAAPQGPTRRMSRGAGRTGQPYVPHRRRPSAPSRTVTISRQRCPPGEMRQSTRCGVRRRQPSR